MLRTEETRDNWKFQDNVGKLIVNVLKASDRTLWCISDVGISTYNGVNWTNHLPWDQPGIVDWKGLIYETKDGTVWFAYYSFKDRTPIRHDMPLGKAGVLLPLLKGVGRFARDQANNSPDTPYREVT